MGFSSSRAPCHRVRRAGRTLQAPRCWQGPAPASLSSWPLRVFTGKITPGSSRRVSGVLLGHNPGRAVTCHPWTVGNPGLLETKRSDGEVWLAEKVFPCRQHPPHLCPHLTQEESSRKWPLPQPGVVGGCHVGGSHGRPGVEQLLTCRFPKL